MIKATDYGQAITIRPEYFAPPQRSGGWGPFAESFIRFNRAALESLEVSIEINTDSTGTAIRFAPGGCAGAVPLRSAQTGRVEGGFLVEPRFKWQGVGRVLLDTGWAAVPKFLPFSMVPGSGREIPPWVLAGPILTRLEFLLRTMRRGYQEVEQIKRTPRGRILWSRYIQESLSRGYWDKLPCRFQELEADPKLLRHIRWTIDRVRTGLIGAGGQDAVAIALAACAHRLTEMLNGVVPLEPRKHDLNRILEGHSLMAEGLRKGLEAISWIVDQRGLGGGQEQDGLPWSLELSKLWECYVEAVIRKEAAGYGGQVSVGRLKETTFPIQWSDPIHKSLGHLEPDIVIKRGRSIQIVDAKYKSHFAEIDESGWYAFEEQTRSAHRADIHQVLAYAALYDADELSATLVYPLRPQTWQALSSKGRDRSVAHLYRGGRLFRLELRGLPFGMVDTSPRASCGLISQEIA